MEHGIGGPLTRRQAIVGGVAASVATMAGVRGPALAAAAPDTIRIYGVSTMALKDWSVFTKATGLKVEFNPTGAEPGAYMREISANQIGDNTDIFIFVGNTPSVLGPGGFYANLGDKLPSLEIWKTIPDTLKTGPNNVENGVTYGVPVINNADSFGFWAEDLGIANPTERQSWELMFESEKTKGKVALENYSVSSLTHFAAWVKLKGIGKVDDPADLTPDEAKLVVDYAISRKKAGQFKTFFTTFDEQVDLLQRKEILALNCWEPCVKEVNKNLGKEGVYYAYAEYHYKWGDSAYVSPAALKAGRWDVISKALSFFMGEGGIYRALQARDRGYGGPHMELAEKYAQEANWPPADIAAIEAVTKKIDRKYALPFFGKTVPKNAAVMEEQWQRFVAA
jgi:putative spermidine/putrescine transport system substrate-binding protein